jgi:RNA polymerase sigma-70 factor (ECF subfamily)
MREAAEVTPEVLERNLGGLRRAAVWLCASRWEADDLVQETCLRLLRTRRVVRPGGESAYLQTALRNTLADRYRRDARRPVALVGTAASRDPDLAATDPHDRAVACELLAHIAELPAGQRDALVAVDVAGLTYSEAARALDVPAGTIMSRLARGRTRVAAAAA